MSNNAEIIIIGGGIIGCATAYYLAKNGVKDVIVLEGSDLWVTEAHQEMVVV